MFHVGSEVFIICIEMYMLQTFPFDFRPLAILAALVIQAFILCYTGEELQTEGARLREALWNVNWKDMRKDNQYRLLMIMIGNTRGLVFCAGGVYELNLELFTQV